MDWCCWVYLEVFNFTGGIVLLSTDLRHGLESEILLIVVHKPGRTLGYVVEAESEGNQEDQSPKAEPVPGEGAPHDVAGDDAHGCHNL